VGTLLLVMSDFLNPSRGPEQSGGFEVSPAFFVTLFGVGFMIGIAGHVFRSRTLVAIGVLMIFLATVLIPVYLQATR
jgi:hypothetical protein